MIGNLTDTQIQFILHHELVGRVGCLTQDGVYVVPISYVYDGQHIFAHTQAGLKIQAMRHNPQVCFEVDNLKDMGNWQSVILWGRFEEIKDKQERNEALKLLLDRKLPVVSSITTHLGKSWPFSTDLEDIDGIVFKITINKATGKFESTSKSPVLTG